jgi:hypothetical protein
MDFLHTVAFLRTRSGKTSLVAALAAGAGIGTYLFGIFFIQTILLIGYVAGFVAIMFWEREQRKTSQLVPDVKLTNDEKWSRKKRRLEQIERELGKQQKSSDLQERRTLLQEKRELENELRRIEWSIKESSLAEVYNANLGRLREIGKALEERGSERNLPTDAQSALSRKEKLETDQGSDETDRDPQEDSRKKNNGEGKKPEDTELEDRRNLERIILTVESILKSEPDESLKMSLVPLANEIRAHYNAIKKRVGSPDVLSDYWVTWAVLSSVINEIPVDRTLERYSSPAFRARFDEFLNAALLRFASKARKIETKAVTEEKDDSADLV